MKHSALFLSSLNQNVQTGYMNALREAGWGVSSCRPVHRLGMSQILRDRQVGVIFANEYSDLEHLPISAINHMGILVCLERCPRLGAQVKCADYPVVGDDHGDLAKDLKLLFSYTHIEPDAWSTVFGLDCGGPELQHLPFAGDLCVPVPTNTAIGFCFSCIMHLYGKDEVVSRWLLPLLRHVGGRFPCCLGGNGWQQHGISSVPVVQGVSARINAYASSLLSLNLHYQAVRDWRLYIGHRTFEIALAGGEQVVDTQLARKYAGPHAVVVEDPTSLIELVEGATGKHAPKTRRRNVSENLLHVIGQHTYFHRLASIFDRMEMRQEAAGMRQTVARCAQQRMWNLESQLA